MLYWVPKGRRRPPRAAGGRAGLAGGHQAPPRSRPETSILYCMYIIVFYYVLYIILYYIVLYCIISIPPFAGAQRAPKASPWLPQGPSCASLIASSGLYWTPVACPSSTHRSRPGSIQDRSIDLDLDLAVARHHFNQC